MDSDFESRLNALVAASDGAIWIESGDRDSATQQRLWDEAVAKYGPDEARNWVAPPGNSFHEKGKAADLGGDLKLAAQLAPQFGLWFPMPGDDWEPWHVEPVGSRDGTESPLSKTVKPVNPSSLVRGTKTRDYGDVMSSLFNLKSFQSPQSTADISTQRGGTDPIVAGNPGFLTPELMTILGPGPQVKVPGKGSGGAAAPNSVSNPRLNSGNADLDSFMLALRDLESSGNYTAEGKPTPWGTATGAYQYLDGTWNNYKGYARAKDAPPEIQDEKARQDMLGYYEQFGSWDNVAAAWYSGPNGDWSSGEVKEYVGKVNQRL